MMSNTIYISQTEVVSKVPKSLIWEDGTFMVSHDKSTAYARMMKLRYAIHNETNTIFLRPKIQQKYLSFERLFRFYTNSPDYDDNRTIKVVKL
tara:strand:+ start:81 stop:359 length:279 start_codon:yes stop_codon:yes gene_type:complete